MRPSNAARAFLAPLISILLAACQAEPASAPATEATTAAGDVLIEAVTVLSPERAEPLPGTWVLLREGRIAAVSAEPPRVAPETRRVDGRGRFLIPGLMDSHAHISGVPGLGYGSFGLIERHPDLVAAHAAQQPRSFLYFGVTTVVDPAPMSPEDIATFRRAPLHPDLLVCGPAPVAGGYPLVFFDDPEDRVGPYLLHDPARPEDWPASLDPTAHTPEAVVARMREDGARCVKLFIEDGFGDASGWPLPTDEMIAAVRTAAGERGMAVLAHANALDMQRIALGEGADILAHGLWNWNAGDGEPGLPEAVRRHLDAVLASDVLYQPTLRVIDGIHGLYDPAVLEDPRLAEVVPPALLAWLRTEEAGWFREELRRDDFNDLPDALIRAIMNTVISQGERALAYLADGGKPLLLASDYPSSPTYVNQPGYSTYQEILHMAKAGVSPRAIFEAATLNNARAFGLEADHGTVAPGKVANLLLLRRDPLADVTAYDSIETVFLHGEPIARPTLAVGHGDENR